VDEPEFRRDLYRGAALQDGSNVRWQGWRETTAKCATAEFERNQLGLWQRVPVINLRRLVNLGLDYVEGRALATS
jgi:hypothetical protein